MTIPYPSSTNEKKLVKRFSLRVMGIISKHMFSKLGCRSRSDAGEAILFDMKLTKVQIEKVHF